MKAPILRQGKKVHHVNPAVFIETPCTLKQNLVMEVNVKKQQKKTFPIETI
jgi:hypothetical protein